MNEEIGKEIQESAEELMKVDSLASGFKDPFVCLYLDAFFDFLPKSSVIVSIFRHPLKVAESLRIRDGIDYDRGMKVWRSHNYGLLKALEKHNGFVLNFDWLKEKLLSEIDIVREQLGLVKIDLTDWYSEDLFRSDKTYEKDHELPDDIKQIYEKLLEKSNNNLQVKIDVKPPTENELRKIVAQLHLELKKQFDYFKKINQSKLPEAP